MLIYYEPLPLLLALAVIPAIALLIMVYRADKVEREPPGLLLRLVLMGIFATSLAKILEYLGQTLLNAWFREETLLYDVLLYFIVVGLSEEGAKYYELRRMTWFSPEFDCRFDGVVYAVFVSLGFALWENIGYVMQYGVSTALIRAVTAVPGHACFGVYMGCWYSQARFCANNGLEITSRKLRVGAVVLPALLHGAYDFLAASAYAVSGWYFFVFVAALFALTLRTVRKAAREDTFI